MSIETPSTAVTSPKVLRRSTSRTSAAVPSRGADDVANVHLVLLGTPGTKLPSGRDGP